MTRHVEREIVYTRGKKAPVLKFDDLDIDVLTIRVTGDAEGTIRFSRELIQRFAREHEAPHHFTLKVDWRSFRLFWVEGFGT